jgi:2'-5' RNA ligase
MPVAPQYAVVCYIDGELAAFVQSLRRELAPEQAHLRAHITLLPPRRLQIREEKALALVRTVADGRTAISVMLAVKPQTFLPMSPTIYLPVASGAERLCDLHTALNASGLLAAEPWAYVPHVTMANLPNPGQTRSDLELCAARWKNYSGARQFVVDHLVFVSEDASGRWLDLGRFSLQSQAAAQP